MKFVFLLFPFLFFLQISSLLSQAPPIEWQHSYGSNNGDYPKKIKLTSDGGFIVVGYTESNGGDVDGYHGNYLVGDCWLLKLNSAGKIEWKKTLGGNSVDYGIDIHQTADGSFMIAGSSASESCDISDSHGGVDYWLMKLTPKGDLMWERRYGGSKNDYCLSMDLIPGGGFMLSGNTESNDGDVTGNLGERDIWVLKLDENGNITWQKNLGGTKDEDGTSGQVTKDGGYIITGFTESNDGNVSGHHGKRDVWVVKLSGNGNLEFQICLGGSAFEGGNSIKQTTDGGYIVAGYTGSNDGDVSGNHHDIGLYLDYWLVKLDNKGLKQWSKCYGGNSNDLAFCVNLTGDGGYVIAGAAEANDGDATCNKGATSAWIVKTNNTGGILWQKSIGGSYFEEAFSIQPLPDGSYIIAAMTCSKETAGYHPSLGGFGSCGDFFLFKLAAPTIVNPVPVVAINPASANICKGKATLTTNVSYAGTLYTYQWLRNGIDVSVNTPTYTGFDFKDNEVITCKITTGNDCDISFATATNTIVLKENSKQFNPQVIITSGNTGLCGECTAVTFQANISNAGTNGVLKWLVNDNYLGGGGNNYTTSLLKPGDNVKLFYTDTLACLTNGDVTSNILIMNAGTGLTPAVNIVSTSINSCKGIPVRFDATTSNAGNKPDFQWKINGVNAGTNSSVFISTLLNDKDIITCIITKDSTFSCATINTATSNSIQTTFLPDALPQVFIIATDSTICKGIPVTFTAKTNNVAGNPFYQWQINGLPAGSNNNSFISADLVDGSLVTCVIKADSSTTCATALTAVSNAIRVTVKTALAPTITITASTNNICAGTPVTFTASAANTGLNPSFLWSVNRINVGVSPPVNTLHNLKNYDTVLCTLLDVNNTCSGSGIASNIIIMQFSDLPLITVSPADTVVKKGAVVQFETIVSGSITRFDWQPANQLENSSIISPKTLPLQTSGSYKITVENTEGCVAEKTVTIRLSTKLFMPNAFSPNGDGKNEVFRVPVNTTLALINFSIYNRFGKRVFSTNNIDLGWNGKVAGIKADMGVYVYQVTGTDDNGPVNTSGSFLLTR
ncbi:MAG: gliding motility-associated C-terminal domain-containing protein [Bacteroidota bacterium]